MSKNREAALRAAMLKAFNYGQTYWQQADSHFVSQQNKSDITREAFNKLVNDTVRSVFAEPEQEPVGWIYDWDAEGSLIRDWVTVVKEKIPADALNVRPLYTSPQPREWQELSKEEIDRIHEPFLSLNAAYKAISAALSAKNEVKA